MWPDPDQSVAAKEAKAHLGNTMAMNGAILQARGAGIDGSIVSGGRGASNLEIARVADQVRGATIA